MIIILLFVIAEHIFLAGAVIFLLARRLKYTRGLHKYLMQLQATPSFSVVETKELYREQKIFIQTPEVGVYLKRLYHTRSHKHKLVSSLLYILKGKADVVMGDKKFVIKPGQYLYVPALVVHDWKIQKPYKYVEYLEVSNPSFIFAPPDDTVWGK